MSSVVRISAAVAEDLLDVSGASDSMLQLVLAGGWNMKSKQMMYSGLYGSQVFHYERKSYKYRKEKTRLNPDILN